MLSLQNYKLAWIARHNPPAEKFESIMRAIIRNNQVNQEVMIHGI